MKNIFIYCTIVFMSLLHLDVHATELTDYANFIKLNSDELLKIGNDYENRHSMDSALVIYSILSKRTYNNNDKDEIAKCCKAYIRKSLIYFSYFYDYTQAYENLISAMELKNEAKIDLSVVDNTAAVFYHVIAVTCRDWKMERMAMDYCYEAYKSALQDGDRDNMDIIISNMIVMSCNLNESVMLDKIWKSYIKHKGTSFAYRFNEHFYKYLKFINAKKYNDAIEEARKMLSLSENSNFHHHIIVCYNCLVEANEKKGDFETALSYIHEEEVLVDKWNLRDVAIELLNTKENIYRTIGDKESADNCSRMYYQKKDSLLNLHEMTNICRTQYNGESRKMEKEIEEITIENKIYNKVLTAFIIFFLILVVMVVMLYVKIKELKKSNMTIYDNSVENIKKQEDERLKLKDEVKKLQVEANNTGENTECPVIDEDKYKTNTLSTDDKKKLLDKILNVMDDVNEFCSESFTVTRLAELTNSKYNYVSQVINENYGCNFNNFLNKFRVQEACRRLSDDENYGNYTIDTISSSLGFKSRTTLATSFKKIVGLTPSQYRKIAKKKNIK